MKKRTAIKIILVADILMIVFLLSMFIRANAEYVNAPEGLNIRSEPSTDAEVLDVLPFAEEVHGDVVGSWMKLADRSGYVKIDHLIENNPLDECEYLGQWRVTAYAATGNMTASGTWPQRGWTLATNTLEFGTIVYLKNLGIWRVEDRGPDNLGCAWCDLFLENEADCIAFGETTTEVYLLHAP